MMFMFHSLFLSKMAVISINNATVGMESPGMRAPSPNLSPVWSNSSFGISLLFHMDIKACLPKSSTSFTMM